MREVHTLEPVEEINEEVDHKFEEIDSFDGRSWEWYRMIICHHFVCRLEDDSG